MRRIDRLHRERRLGLAMIAAAALAFAGMIGGAAYADSLRGISASASLSAWGF